MTITELSIKRPTLVVVIFTALIVLGLFSYFQLQYELLPKMSVPWVSVVTVYPGASPKVVETTISKVIEDAVSTMDQVKNVYATSREGVSVVSIEFVTSADINQALPDAQRKVNEVRSRLPDGIKEPVISKFAIDELPVLRLGVTAGMPGPVFAQFLKDNIQPSLAKLAGVGQISFLGTEEREIRVNVDLQRLRAYNLPLLLVTQAIKMANLDFPTGNVKDQDKQFVVRLAGKIGSLDELRRLVIGKAENGGEIKLQDVAEVQDTVCEPTHFTRLNGKPAVGLLIQKQNDANVVQVSQLVRAELKRLEREYAAHSLKFDISQDQSTFTVQAADAVKTDLLWAILLVGLVMLVFLHSIRNALIVMVAIPCSLISTFIAMLAFGFTLNMMTLMAMSLMIGILVDDSIVVLENIHRHLELGKEPRQAALTGRNEIGFTALSITLVDVVVFLPMSLLSGLIGDIVREYALVIVVATLLSLFVSFTVTPLLASRFSRLEEAVRGTLMGRFGDWFEIRYERLTGLYERLLRWALARPGRVMAIATLLFLAAIMLMPLGFVGGEFMPQTDRGQFTVTLELPTGAKLTDTNEAAQRVEKSISAIPEVRKIFTDVGASSEGFMGQSSTNVAALDIALMDKRLRRRSTADVIRDIKQRVGGVAGMTMRANPIGMFGMADESPIQIGVSGTSFEDVSRAARMLLEVVKRVPGTDEVRLSSEEGNPETRIDIDRDKLASLGLTLGEVGMSLQTALTGDDQSKYQDGPNEYPIRVILDQFDRSRTADMENLFFVNSRDQAVELKQFATITQTTGPNKLERRNRVYNIWVRSQAVGRPSGSIGDDIFRAVRGMKLPPNVTIYAAGDLEMQQDAFRSLGLAMAAAILFVYLIMVALYNSYIHPFVVLFSIPMAVVGAFFALALTNNSLNVMPFVGLIMLTGLVAKNAILLVDFTNRRRQDGLDVVPALLEAGKVRLRPILMTTMTMVFGMAPIAISTSSASEMKSGLGWVLIGGLTSSLLLTLLLVPVIYLKLENVRLRLTRKGR
jgi:hydrophobic/amphiphilic exporter-1 (mainly G- bacteria), HAE1 family